jgi:hypothetical protein
MHYSAGFTLLLVVLVGSVRSASAQAGEKGETPEPNLEKPVSSPAPETEAPNIDALSERAIEHYEIPACVSTASARSILATAASFAMTAICAPVIGVTISEGLAHSPRTAPGGPAILFGATRQTAPATIRQRTMAPLAAAIACLGILCAAAANAFASWAVRVRLRCSRKEVPHVLRLQIPACSRAEPRADGGMY